MHVSLCYCTFNIAVDDMPQASIELSTAGICDTELSGSLYDNDTDDNDTDDDGNNNCFSSPDSGGLENIYCIVCLQEF